MTDNGNKEILRVNIEGGSMKVTFGEVNLALISHALRVASLEVDNQIIGMQQPIQSKIVSDAPSVDLIKRIRGQNG